MRDWGCSDHESGLKERKENAACGSNELLQHGLQRVSRRSRFVVCVQHCSIICKNTSEVKKGSHLLFKTDLSFALVKYT
jgi:hypothetical protein